MASFDLHNKHVACFESPATEPPATSVPPLRFLWRSNIRFQTRFGCLLHYLLTFLLNRSLTKLDFKICA